jgi:hypothetical protein
MNINLDYLKKNQNDVILVKKKTKVNGLQPIFDQVLSGQPGQLAGSSESHRVMTFLIFFQPDPVPVPGRSGPGSTRRVGPGFKTIAFTASKRLISIKMLILQCKMKCLIK